MIYPKEDIQAIFNTHYNSMVVFAHTFLPDVDECKDIVQNVFVRLWKLETTFPNETALKAYKYNAVKNACLNKLKHQKVREKYRLQLKKRISENIFLEETNTINDKSRVLYMAIETLSSRKKEVIALTLRGMSNVTIAEQLGIALNTVKNLKSKSYKDVRLYFHENK